MRGRGSAMVAMVTLVAALGLIALPAGGQPRQQGDTGARPGTLAPVDEGEVPPRVQRVARDVVRLPLGQRMKAVSDALLGQPYLVDPTGEGVEPDPDPPARYDAFDCLTFVEEVLALTLSGDPSGAPRVRQALRYGSGSVAYQDRRHFMLTEWIPDNIADGWLVDITDTLGETHLLDKEITAETWRWWRRRSLFSLPDSKLPAGRYQLPLLSLDAAMAAAAEIPAGALILTVRQSKDGVPIVVTHLGFKLPDTGDRPMVRHATKMRGQRVMDHSLVWYLDHLRWYDQWPIDGVSILMPREQGPRVGALSR